MLRQYSALRSYFFGVIGVDASRQPVTKTQLFSWMELLYLLLLQDQLFTLAKWSLTYCYLPMLSRKHIFPLRPKTTELNTNDHSIFLGKESSIKSCRPNTIGKLYRYFCRYLKVVCQKDGPGSSQWSQAIGQEAMDQTSST